jgi:hypothetical protein
MSIAFIGDIHGDYLRYEEITKSNEYTVQVGDFGFSYGIFDRIDTSKHVFIPGNHDNHDRLMSFPPDSYLGRYGHCSLNQIQFMFCGGGFSLDKNIRLQRFYKTGKQSWWGNEELSYAEGLDFLDLYGKIKPDLMVTHSAPAEIARIIGNPYVLERFGFNPETFRTSTQILLQSALDIHVPEKWFFGHFHHSEILNHKGCEFRLLDIKEVVVHV